MENHHWPSLYEECNNCLTAAVLVYALTDVRQQIRNGKQLDRDLKEALMTVPFKIEPLIPLLKNNEKVFAPVLGDEGRKDQNGEMRYPYLETLMKKREPKQEKFNSSDNSNKVDPDVNHDSGHVVLECHDENPNQMVYIIELCHPRKTIQVSFRGSVTTRDLLSGFDPLLESFPNPVEGMLDNPQEESIGIHASFKLYLDGMGPSFGKGDSRKITKRISELQGRYPNYRTYLTGHSLGAALATLMTFILATTDEIQKPITCVGVATPMVGNASFMHAFQALEDMGRIRCVRIINHLDIIDNLPTRAFWSLELFCCCVTCLIGTVQSRKYWPVGARIVLYSGGRCKVSYERRHRSYREQLEKELSGEGTVCKLAKLLWRKQWCRNNEDDLLRNHACIEYTSRLDAAKEYLENKYLEELYYCKAKESIDTKPKSNYGSI